MASEVHVRLAMLRYMEEKTAGLLSHVVSNEPGLDKNVSVELCDAFEAHERHAKELNDVLRDLGDQAAAVPPTFAESVDARIAQVGASETKDQVLDNLASLEMFAVEQYHRALSTAGPEAHGVLNAQLLEEQRHAQVLLSAQGEYRA